MPIGRVTTAINVMALGHMPEPCILAVNDGRCVMHADRALRLRARSTGMGISRDLVISRLGGLPLRARFEEWFGGFVVVSSFSDGTREVRMRWVLSRRLCLGGFV